jgi:hypothetical protein
MLKRIHVNMHIIRRNQREGRRDAPLSIKTSRGNVKAHHVDILGPSTLIYAPDKPLACGARVWIHTDSPLLVDVGDESLSLP